MLANLGAAVYLKRGQPIETAESRARARSEAVIARYGIDFFKRVYPDKTEEQIRQRVAHDLHYIEHWSLRLDIKILWLTFVREVFSRHAF